MNVPFEDLRFMTGPDDERGLHEGTCPMCNPQETADKEAAGDHEQGAAQPGKE